MKNMFFLILFIFTPFAIYFNFYLVRIELTYEIIKLNYPVILPKYLRPYLIFFTLIYFFLSFTFIINILPQWLYQVLVLFFTTEAILRLIIPEAALPFKLGKIAGWVTRLFVRYINKIIIISIILFLLQLLIDKYFPSTSLLTIIPTSVIVWIFIFGILRVYLIKDRFKSHALQHIEMEYYYSNEKNEKNNKVNEINKKANFFFFSSLLSIPVVVFYANILLNQAEFTSNNWYHGAIGFLLSFFLSFFLGEKPE